MIPVNARKILYSAMSIILALSFLELQARENVTPRLGTVVRQRGG